MRGNRYREAIHEKAIICPDDACEVRNAPEGSKDYRSTCWRCGIDLPKSSIEEGDTVPVTVIDEKSDGTSVTKADTGIVIFVTDDVISPEITVKVTDMARNCAYGEVIDEDASTTSEKDQPDATEEKQPGRLGSRENFWED